MHEPWHTLLNAYLDGELHGERLNNMANHLAACETCQHELQEMKHLSLLLQAAPSPESIPVDRFVSRLTMSLPRRTMRSKPDRLNPLAWWFIPAGLLGMWSFMQVVFILTNLVTAAGTAGWLGPASQWLASDQVTLWFSATASLLGSQAASQPALVAANDLNILGGSLINSFLWQALIALSYGLWILTWFIGGKFQPVATQSHEPMI